MKSMEMNVIPCLLIDRTVSPKPLNICFNSSRSALISFFSERVSEMYRCLIYDEIIPATKMEMYPHLIAALIPYRSTTAPKNDGESTPTSDGPTIHTA